MGTSDVRTTVKMEYFNEYCMWKKSMFQPTFKQFSEIIFLSTIVLTCFRLYFVAFVTKGYLRQDGDVMNAVAG